MLVGESREKRTYNMYMSEVDLHISLFLIFRRIKHESLGEKERTWTKLSLPYYETVWGRKMKESQLLYLYKSEVDTMRERE